MEDNLKILKLQKDFFVDKKKYFEDKIKNLSDKKLKLEIDGGIKTPNIGFKQSIINFFKSEFFGFIKRYLFFMILFTLCFYILFHVNSTTKNNMIITENKIFFYLVVIFIMIIINDLMEINQEYLFKFTFLILISLIISYYAMTYIYKLNINHNNDKNTRYSEYGIKGIIVTLSTIFISIITIIIFYFQFKKKHDFASFNLMNSFNKAINKNYIFVIFIFIYVYFYSRIYYHLSWNNSLTDIICPTVLGSVLLFFLFCFFIFMALKMKIINQLQILNSFIAFYSILFFIIISNLYIFTNSLNSVCTEATHETIEQSNNSERLILLIIFALIIILWLDDSRDWHQIGSIFFIIATIITLLTMFYYSTIYPTISIPAFWLFIEWMIIIFRRKENSKNSFHYSFMNV
jgi:hypothetical protein